MSTGHQTTRFQKPSRKLQRSDWKWSLTNTRSPSMRAICNKQSKVHCDRHHHWGCFVEGFGAATRFRRRRQIFPSREFRHGYLGLQLAPWRRPFAIFCPANVNIITVTIYFNLCHHHHPPRRWWWWFWFWPPGSIWLPSYCWQLTTSTPRTFPRPRCPPPTGGLLKWDTKYNT